MRKVRKVYPKLVKDNIIPRSKTVVFMNPKEFPFEAGLTDRFKGIISVYDACKRKGLPFKIYYTTPNLNDFLLPNLYDWHIDKEDICFDLRYTSTCYLVTYHHDDNYWQLFTQRCALNFFLKNRRKKQIHVFSNTTTSDARYGELYNELFNPTPLLKKQIDYHLEQLGGGKYVSVSFRIMNLFGDFKTEGKELGQDEKKILLDRCCKTIEYVHKMHSNMRILVATDSTTLLNMASTIPYVYIIPGEIIHTGYQISSDVESAMKTFVDMYMISYAKIVYQVRDPLLYHSGFPLRAARISGTDYQEINMEY